MLVRAGKITLGCAHQLPVMHFLPEYLGYTADLELCSAMAPITLVGSALLDITLVYVLNERWQY